MKKIKNTKGFTLMEMLIVVAIIAILIAIAIPTFNSSLNKAKVATDEANIRSGYASVMTAILTEDTPTGKYTLYADGTAVKEGGTAPTGIEEYKTKGKNTDANVAVGGIKVGIWEPGKPVTYTVTQTNDGYKVTINVDSTSNPAPSNP